MRRATKWILATAVGSALAVVAAVVTLHAYQSYWVRGAEEAVTRAADALASNETLPELELSASVDRPAVSRALASGYRISGFDSIGFGFRAYEIKLRVADGDQYNFSAHHRDGQWHLDCCTRWAGSELP